MKRHTTCVEQNTEALEQNRVTMNTSYTQLLDI